MKLNEVAGNCGYCGQIVRDQEPHVATEPPLHWACRPTIERAEAERDRIREAGDELNRLVGEVTGYMSNNERSWAKRWCREADAALAAYRSASPTPDAEEGNG